MKFDCGASWETRWQQRKDGTHPRQQWRRWFAWHPVRLSDHDCRWLEFVEKREDYNLWRCEWKPEYRALCTEDGAK